MSLFRPVPGEPRSDKIRRAAFWLLVIVALAVVATAASRAIGRASVPDVGTLAGHAAARVGWS